MPHVMLTEQEAKQKWCPFSRVIPGIMKNGFMVPAPSGVGGHNRVQEPHPTEPTWNAAMQCMASECMAWRWADPETKTIPAETAGWLNENGSITQREIKAAHDIPFPNRSGHCGLAGTP